MPRKQNPYGPVDGFAKSKAPAKKGSNPIQPVRASKNAEPSQTILERPKMVPFRTPRMEDLPEGWQEKFLEELSIIPLVVKASRKVGVSTRTCYRYKEDDPEFSEAWEIAIKDGKERHLEMIQEQAAMGSVQASIWLGDKWNFPKEVAQENKDKTLQVGWKRTKK